MADKPYTLGVSGLRSGFAVSLFQNDSLVFAVEEDKLRRSKGAGIREGHPRASQAVAAAMAFGKVSVDAVERIVYVPPLDATAEQAAAEVAFLSRFLDRYHGIDSPVTTVDHLQAQMAFAASVDPDAEAVLMVGRTRVADARVGDGLQVRKTSDCEVVRTVEQLAEFLGLSVGRIHHLENMARLGEARFTPTVDAVVSEAGASSPVDVLERALEKPRLRPGAPLTSEYLDVAASIHDVLTERVRRLVAPLMDSEGVGKLALSGGVFHSWSLNDALSRAFGEGRFGVSFAPGNSGCAIGGFMTENPDAMNRRPLPFLGPRYSRDEVKAVLDNCKTRYTFHSLSEIMDQVAEALKEGKMVGWFADRCEFGLRALGARSVFTNPANPYACDNLSSYLKRRPSYMSYAVVMTEEAAPVSSPFMSRSTTLPEYFGDNPVRIQSVSKGGAPVLHQLLSVCEARLSVPALLNTSLNYFDEPIACAPRDAVKTFYASGLDMLVMENFILRKGAIGRL